MQTPHVVGSSFNSCLLVLLLASAAMADAPSAASLEHFEKRVRPLLVDRCYECHAGDEHEGGLRLDSAAAARRGGESGAAIVPGVPDSSRLIQAVRQSDGLAMPPDGKLSEAQIADLTEWVRSGAAWPGDDTEPTAEQRSPAGPQPLGPNEGPLAAALQLWVSADSLTLADGAAVSTWPDRSPARRDLAATHGTINGGTGQPGKFVRASSIQMRPAVRFDPAVGLASAPGNPVSIHGDAALSILLVVNLQPNDSPQRLDGIVGLGNPAHAPQDPGKPMAALVAIDRGDGHALMLAGGWLHDASLGPNSFRPLYDRPIVLTVVKRPGPMNSTTSIYVDGQRLGSADRPLAGRDTVPDIQHRTDMGVYLGKALDWAGSIRGDVGEVVIYNKALEDPERQAVEGSLAEKYAILLEPQIAATRAVFSEKERSHWALKPVAKVQPPDAPAQQPDEPASPIDRFLDAQLAKSGLKPAPAADRRSLVRRLAFDLTGLPPTVAETDAFVTDDQPQAYERLVERLLASRQYGEHWGRHWLDAVRYADTTANDANAVMRQAWRYRNYVIDAFNRDVPYDRFLTEQLAGDLLPDAADAADALRRAVATGFLMVGPKALAETDKEQSRLDIVDDQLDVIGRAMLGLTVTCARCHDHKFDAIRAADYYALAGILRSTEPLKTEDRNASMWWEYPLPDGQGGESLVMAPRESSPRNLRIHIRGNRFTLGQLVPRGFLQVVDPAAPVIPAIASGRLELARWIARADNPLTARVMVNRIWQGHFGRGLVATSDNFGVRGEPPSHPELLDWLAGQFIESGWSIKAMHRLIVNSHAYRRSCATDDRARELDPDNRLLSHFSRRRLSAEELRDALLHVGGKLDRTVDNGQSSEFLWERAEKADDKGEVRPNRLTADDPFYSTFRRRTVYLPIVRNMLPDVLALFDAADPNSVTTARGDTTVPSQSLFMLNNPIVRELSRSFAEQLLADAQATDRQRIERAHQTALCRLPRADEIEQAETFLAAYQQAAAAQTRPEGERRLSAWQSYCQALFCTNEFLYCD